MKLTHILSSCSIIETEYETGDHDDEKGKEFSRSISSEDRQRIIDELNNKKNNYSDDDGDDAADTDADDEDDGDVSRNKNDGEYKYNDEPPEVNTRLLYRYVGLVKKNKNKKQTFRECSHKNPSCYCINI